MRGPRVASRETSKRTVVVDSGEVGDGVPAGHVDSEPAVDETDSVGCIDDAVGSESPGTAEALGVR
jgi:hypothetical protein